MISSLATTETESHPEDFCRICTEFDSREISGSAQSLARNGHLSISSSFCITGDLGL